MYHTRVLVLTRDLRFGDLVAAASAADGILMLTTFANLASSRTASNPDEERFVRYVTSELVYVSLSW